MKPCGYFFLIFANYCRNSFRSRYKDPNIPLLLPLGWFSRKLILPAAGSYSFGYLIYEFYKHALKRACMLLARCRSSQILLKKLLSPADGDSCTDNIYTLTNAANIHIHYVVFDPLMYDYLVYSFSRLCIKLNEWWMVRRVPLQL